MTRFPTEAEELEGEPEKPRKHSLTASVLLSDLLVCHSLVVSPWEQQVDYEMRID